VNRVHRGASFQAARDVERRILRHVDVDHAAYPHSLSPLRSTSRRGSDWAQVVGARCRQRRTHRASECTVRVEYEFACARSSRSCAIPRSIREVGTIGKAGGVLKLCAARRTERRSGRMANSMIPVLGELESSSPELPESTRERRGALLDPWRAPEPPRVDGRAVPRVDRCRPGSTASACAWRRPLDRPRERREYGLSATCRSQPDNTDRMRRQSAVGIFPECLQPMMDSRMAHPENACMMYRVATSAKPSRRVPSRIPYRCCG